MIYGEEMAMIYGEEIESFLIKIFKSLGGNK